MTDPAGIARETFHTLSDVPVVGSADAVPVEIPRSGCDYAPRAEPGTKSCCNDERATPARAPVKRLLHEPAVTDDQRLAGERIRRE